MSVQNSFAYHRSLANSMRYEILLPLVDRLPDLAAESGPTDAIIEAMKLSVDLDRPAIRAVTGATDFVIATLGGVVREKGMAAAFDMAFDALNVASASIMPATECATRDAVLDFILANLEDGRENIFARRTAALGVMQRIPEAHPLYPRASAAFRKYDELHAT